MNVIIANTKEECAQWKGTAAVVDVLRGTTTVCALAKAGKKDIFLFHDAQSLQMFAGEHAGLDIFADMEVLISHQDNSPYLALKAGSGMAAVLSQGASAAVFSLKKAKKILLGGFCNFEGLAEALANETDDVLLVPASIFDTPEDVEDVLCVGALKDFLQGVSRPEGALADFYSTVRGIDYRKNGPKTAEKDLKEALRIDGMPGVLQATLVGPRGYAVCYPLGQEIPKKWMDEATLSGAPATGDKTQIGSSMPAIGTTTVWQTSFGQKDWDKTQMLDPVTRISLAGSTPKKENPVSPEPGNNHVAESHEETPAQQPSADPVSEHATQEEQSQAEPTPQVEDKPEPKEEQGGGFFKRGFFKDIAQKAQAKAQDLKKEAEALKEKAQEKAEALKEKAQEKAQDLKEKASSGDNAQKAAQAKEAAKGFFGKILRSIKEEKADLEQTMNKEAQQTMRTTRKFDDPFDALLKQADQKKSASAQDETQTPVQEGAAPVEQESARPQEESTVKLSAQKPEESVPVAEEASVRLSPASEEADVQESAHPAESEPMDQPSSPDELVVPADVTFSVKKENFEQDRKKKAIVLFSGGLDSTTCLYWALAQGYECETLTVLYGQRHDKEVLAAKGIAKGLGLKHHVITLNLPWLVECALVDREQELPDIPVEQIPNAGIPSTYVPGRNLMFLSIAGSLLDSTGADAIIAGPNAVDFSGYPDCTPAFFKAAADALNRGTKQGVSEGIEVLAPLMRLSKAQIVQLGAKLHVPFELTWSCYAGGEKPCGHCDSCKLRAKGFAEAGVHDPALD